MKKGNSLTSGNIRSVIIAFAIPIFIGNLFNLAYALADTRIIGSFLGNEALAAVGSISTLSDFFTSFIVGLANGFGVVCAQYFGRKDQQKVRRSFGATLFMGAVIILILMVISLLGLNVIMDLLNVMPEHRAASKEYISIIIMGMIFAMFYNGLAAILRAIGDAFTPLIFLIVSALLNIGMDILFVGALHFGVKGAAIGTVLAQFISVVLCFIYLWKKYPELHITAAELIPDRKMARKMLMTGFSMGLMGCLVALGTLTLQTAINTLGTNIIVAHAATRKLTNMFMLPFSALATAIATFVGQNYGAAKYDRIKQGIRFTMLVSFLWWAVVVLISYTICPLLIQAITDTKIAEVIDTACLYQRVDTIVYGLVPTISIFRNSLQGMDDHMTPIISSGLELLGKVSIALLLTPVIGYWAIIFAEPIIWVIMVIPLIISIVKKFRRMSM